MAQQYIVITWDRLHRDARTLAAHLAARLGEGRRFAGIVAISRGGLVPAAIIARELDCRGIETVSILTYAEEERGTPEVVKLPIAAGDGAGWLVIDDLVDTGATARAVRAVLPKAHFAVLYAKPAGLPMADDFITEVPQTTW